MVAWSLLVAMLGLGLIGASPAAAQPEEPQLVTVSGSFTDPGYENAEWVTVVFRSTTDRTKTFTTACWCSHGAYSLQVEPGEYTMHASYGNNRGLLTPLVTFYPGTASVREAEPLTVPETGLTGLDLVLEQAHGPAFLLGTVTGPDDQPVAGATVRFVAVSDGEEYTTVTGADGTYELTVPVDRYEGDVTAPGWRQTSYGFHWEPMFSSAENRYLDFQMEQATRLYGTLRAAPGSAPLENVSLLLVDKNTMMPPEGVGPIVPAADGSFSVTAPRGEYLLAAVDPRDAQDEDDDIYTFYAGAGFIDDATTIVVDGSQAERDVSFQLAAAGGPAGVRGTVRAATDDDAPGAPIAGAKITFTPVDGGAAPAPVTADAAGKWQARVPAGEYDITASKPGWRASTTNATLGASLWNDAVDLQLQVGPATIGGHVTAGGKPVAEAEVRVYPADGTSPQLAIADAAGVFSMETEVYGATRVVASAPGYAETSVEVNAQEGAVLDVTLELAAVPADVPAPEGPQHGDAPAPQPGPGVAPVAPPAGSAPTVTGVPAPKGKKAAPASVSAKGELLGITVGCAAGQACGTAGLSYQAPAVKTKGKKVTPKPVEITTVKGGKLVLTKQGKKLVKAAGSKGLTVELQLRDAAGTVVKTVKLKLKAEQKKSGKKQPAKKKAVA